MQAKAESCSPPDVFRKWELLCEGGRAKREGGKVRQEEGGAQRKGEGFLA